MATLYNPHSEYAGGGGGGGLLDIPEDKFCKVAIINTAPLDLHLERDDFIHAVEVIEPRTTQVQPIDKIPIARMFAIQEVKTEMFQTLRQRILADTPQERQEELSLRLQRHSKILRPRLSSGPVPKDPQGCTNQEPVYRTHGKIPRAHLTIIEETLQQWVRIGLIRRADSLFNTPLFCLRHNYKYRVVQDFWPGNKTLPQEPIILRKSTRSWPKLSSKSPNSSPPLTSLISPLR